MDDQETVLTTAEDITEPVDVAGDDQTAELSPEDQAQAQAEGLFDGKGSEDDAAAKEEAEATEEQDAKSDAESDEKQDALTITKHSRCRKAWRWMTVRSINSSRSRKRPAPDQANACRSLSIFTPKQ